MTNEADRKASIPPWAELPSANAPHIFFEAVSVAGFDDGIARISMEVRRFNFVGQSQIAVDRVTVAHLRMSSAGFTSLKNAVEKLELMMKPAPPGPTN